MWSAITVSPAEDRTPSRLGGLRSDLVDPAIAALHGRIVKRTGDGSLIEFRSVVDAARALLPWPSRGPSSIG
jgi:adenylate cyclase